MRTNSVRTRLRADGAVLLVLDLLVLEKSPDIRAFCYSGPASEIFERGVLAYSVHSIRAVRYLDPPGSQELIRDLGIRLPATFRFWGRAREQAKTRIAAAVGTVAG
jgi:hypothetical protein